MKRFINLILALALVFSLCSCGVENADEMGAIESNKKVSINVYAINNNLSMISKLIISAPFDTNLYTTSCKETMKQNRVVFPDELILKKIEIENNTAKFHFNNVIDNLDDSERMYAAEMLALCVSQYEQAAKIQFFDENGAVDGLMGKAYESGLIAKKDEMNLPVKLVTLFFADKNASGLIREKRLVYVKDILAASIADEIFKGTKDPENKVNVIPQNTVLIGCTQSEDILTLNVSQSFISSENGSDTLSIYSLVNALTELDDVNYVRFSVNDDPNAVLGNYSLGDVFSKRSDLILY